jgi:hypothetical protein
LRLEEKKRMTRSRTFAVVVMLLGLMFGATSAARANDKIVSTVTPISGPVPIIKNNGVPSGTIQLMYTFTGTEFPCGQFATFNLGMVDQAGTSGVSPSYPVGLDLTQSGSGTAVQFSPAPSPNEFSVTAPGWPGNSTVSVSIDCSKLDTPYDGEGIDGNLNEQTIPQGAHLDTISTIQVHITLVYPTQCLKLYSFETEQDSSALLTSVALQVNRGSVKSMSPGQASVDALVVNTCPSPETFDILVGLDPDWETNPHSNPGNATFTYFTTGEVDPSTFNLTTFGTGTPQGEALCLTNVTLPGNESFLTTVHSDIISGLSTSLLPSGNDFDFSATLYQAGSGCAGTPLGSGTVGPSNPATSTVSYTSN